MAEHVHLPAVALAFQIGVFASVLALAACEGPSAPHVDENSVAPRVLETLPAPRLRRLSAVEYSASIRQLLGENVQLPAALRDETIPNGYTNGPETLSIQGEQLNAFLEQALKLAQNTVERDLNRLLPGCSLASATASACFEPLLHGFARRAFRRTLNAEEQQELRTLWLKNRTEWGEALALQSVIAAILTSPSFLYRSELGVGGGASSSATALTLSQPELASELAFLLTGQPPDVELLDLAESGGLDTPTALAEQARRLLATPEALDQLTRFFQGWLGVEGLAQKTKSAVEYPSFSAVLAQEMSDELATVLRDALANGRASPQELLTTDKAWLGPELLALYQANAAPGWANLEPQRQGLLTRAGFLAAHSGFEHSSPVERGVFALGTFLCLTPPAPPPGTPRNVPEVSPGVTTRQRFAQHASNAGCSGCHRYIDGIGFGFEEFDAIGAFRETEHGSPVDASGTLYPATNPIPFVGVKELQQKLLATPEFMGCFTRHVYRFFFGKGESAADIEQLQTLAQALSPRLSLDALLIQWIQSPAFRLRAVPQETAR